MRLTRTYPWMALLVFSVGLPAWAQDSGSQSQSPPAGNPVPPVPAENSGKPAGNSDANPVPPVVMPNVENASLSGARSPSLEPGPRRSFLYPQIEIYSEVDTNAFNAAGSGGNNITSINSILGGLTLQKMGAHSQFNLNYLGGRSFSSAGDQLNSMTHTFGAVEQWSGARWSGVLTDQLVYMSESLFGSVNGADLGSISGVTGITSLRPGFLGEPSIFTSPGPQLSNSSVVELDYQASRRGSWTVLGSYTLVRFFGKDLNGLANSGVTQGQVGYNYQLSHRDTISVLYNFGAIRFGGATRSIDTHSAELAYGHQIAQRLALRLGGGPQFSITRSPLQGTSLVTSWTLSGSLQYQLARTSLEAFYDHSVTAGSGLFFGATTDDVTLSAVRPLSRLWSVGFEGGYARNHNLGSSSTPAANTTVNSMFGGVRLFREIGRTARFFVNYWPRYQTSNVAVCPGKNCGTNSFGQQVAVGFDWHPKPIPLE